MEGAEKMAEMETKIAPDVPEIPAEAIGFARDIAALAERYGLRSVVAQISIHTGVGTKHWTDTGRVQQEMTVTVSRIDGRGRPRTKVSISAAMTVTMNIVNEPDSSN